VRIAVADYPTVLSAMRQGRYQLAYTTWLADFNDASNFLDLLRSGNPGNYAGYYDGVNNGADAPADFTQAAATAIPATVHIKTKTVRQAGNNLPRRSPFGDLFGMDWDDVFGDRARTIPQMASGSGAVRSLSRRNMP
jgi:hypothetical protein